MIRDYSWSPKSAYLAFSMTDTNESRSVHVWSASDATLHRVTDEMFNEESPAWDLDGDFLYYVSDRDFAPQISGFEWNFATNRSTGIFAVTLRKDGKSPFPPQSDEVTFDDKKAEGETKAEDEKPDADKASDEKPDAKDKPKKKETPFRIDWDGLGSRVTRVPVDGDNVDGLAVGKGHLVYGVTGAPFYGRDSYAKPQLKLYSFKDRKATTLVDDASAWTLSRDGTKVLVRQGESLQPLRRQARDEGQEDGLDQGADAGPRARRGVAPSSSTRSGGATGTSSTSGTCTATTGRRSAIVTARSCPTSPTAPTSTTCSARWWPSSTSDTPTSRAATTRSRPARRSRCPGARFELDIAAGRYRIARILAGHNEEEPLPRAAHRGGRRRPGRRLRAGDRRRGAAGRRRPVPAAAPQDRPGHADAQREAGARGLAQDELPADHQRGAAALPRVDEREPRDGREAHERPGRLLHIPDMGAPGIYEFIKWFYPQLRKEGLVVDVRSNGGGNVSQWIIERLDTKLLGTRFGSRSELPGTYPGTVFHGHKVCLLNETSASDGDIFPHMFRKAGLGPLVGKRTWGGVVGITGLGPMIDGGQITVPLSGTNDVDGSWVIEGHGVDPDIVVENDPKSVIVGKDPQLERGVAELLKKMDAEPMRLPKRPADPVKTK